MLRFFIGRKINYGKTIAFEKSINLIIDMKQLFLVTIMVIFIASCNSKEQQPKTQETTTTAKEEYAATIKAQATQMGNALIKKDFTGFAQFNHPRLIEMMGGSDKLIQTMRAGNKQMEEQGVEMTQVEFGEPSPVVKNNRELQATIPQKIIIKTPNGEASKPSVLIAVSMDEGKNWVFVDAGQNNLAGLKKILPNLSDSLAIAPTK